MAKKKHEDLESSVANMVRQVQLADLRLMSTRTAVPVLQVEGHEMPLARIADLEQRINVKTAISDDGDHARLVCLVTFIIKPGADGDGHASGFYLEATFVLAYFLPSRVGLNQQAIQAFGERNAVFNAWPFWREFVQSTTVKGGLPPLRVPLFRVGELKFSPESQPQEKIAPASSMKRKKAKRNR